MLFCVLPIFCNTRQWPPGGTLALFTCDAVQLLLFDQERSIIPLSHDKTRNPKKNYKKSEWWLVWIWKYLNAYLTRVVFFRLIVSPYVTFEPMRAPDENHGSTRATERPRRRENEGRRRFNFVVIFGWISRDGKLGSSDRQRGVSQRINLESATTGR